MADDEALRTSYESLCGAIQSVLRQSGMQVQLKNWQGPIQDNVERLDTVLEVFGTYLHQHTQRHADNFTMSGDDEVVTEMKTLNALLRDARQLLQSVHDARKRHAERMGLQLQEWKAMPSRLPYLMQGGRRPRPTAPTMPTREVPVEIDRPRSDSTDL